MSFEDRLKHIAAEGIKASASWALFWQKLQDALESLHGEQFVEVGMLEWGTGELLSPIVQMPFWPSEISDSVSVNWESKSVPGWNHGLMSWTGSDGREFSFEFALAHEQRNDGGAGSVTGFTDTSQISRYNVPIETVVAFFRLFTLPRYRDNGRGVKVANPPPQIVIRFPNVPIKEDGSDVLYGVVTQFDVNYTKLWEDGKPRIARITLGIKQVIQVGQSIETVAWGDDASEILYDAGALQWGTGRLADILKSK